MEKDEEQRYPVATVIRDYWGILATEDDMLGMLDDIED